jgi:hypothetical protein
VLRRAVGQGRRDAIIWRVMKTSRGRGRGRGVREVCEERNECGAVMSDGSALPGHSHGFRHDDMMTWSIEADEPAGAPPATNAILVPASAQQTLRFDGPRSHHSKIRGDEPVAGRIERPEGLRQARSVASTLTCGCTLRTAIERPIAAQFEGSALRNSPNSGNTTLSTLRSLEPSRLSRLRLSEPSLRVPATIYWQGFPKRAIPNLR